ncbi:MAG: phosphoenolpyruvate carboxykinase (ATP) [Flavobacteriales bacterium]|jgi:phosphoenolpyruvate carboxykinase (ATP)|nr:phosphoenolpyruvate carboxykinase (ATP) [Flavobacteriales bacterium]MBT4704524.1 phosphoenolpyruvate carboxykinase (ATP) [Flavobacteriales bacterium]MBT4931279.1 phosphoenolpyruvate carboxykinase (ATP) [Flavobacteriales bacterium]MBT5131892.1 phosphoenolpyruvate carboxykinase (ATP) [Flavobacteriales bacterium]MBT5976425.1 phosphoenolpyruvate carboxykinase (ATP) [Flavobacteriales bacterium]
MNEFGRKPGNASVSDFGLSGVRNAYWNLEPGELVEDTILNNQGAIASSGALAIDTGEFTGRSPKDKLIVRDAQTEDTVWWDGGFNIPFSPDKVEPLLNRMTAYLQNKDVYVRDCVACSDPEYKLNIRVITEYPWSNLFAYNMFIRPNTEEQESFDNDWTILCVPGFMADPEIDGTRQHNFSILDFTRKIALIGGSGYTGEIKKGIFTVLNYVLPQDRGVLSMHCSANIGKNDDTAVFFGLSGTGKTTLSADPNRQLIGDDEHGWTETGVFNFEGGCYAKCIDLTQEKEPQIWDAIKFGALLENIDFKPDSTEVDFEGCTKTENTRVSYPLHHIDNAMDPSIGGIPKNIFFLTADAFGVLPPLSKLTPGQAMYHFISGYTAKVAGTEAGVTEPQTTFSACFGAPFLPLHPTKYAEMLGEKMKQHNVNIWLVNTGWSGGEYGVGERIKLKYTRAMITAALEGKLDNVDYKTHEVFGLEMPTECPDVPTDILDPKNTWENKDGYDKKASHLAEEFVKNFTEFSDFANEEIMAAAPRVSVGV